MLSVFKDFIERNFVYTIKFKNIDASKVWRICKQNVYHSFNKKDKLMNNKTVSSCLNKLAFAKNLKIKV